MKDIYNLLTQVSIITKKNNEFLDATGGRFNIFRTAGVNHYENTHSTIIAELLNPKGTHGLKGKFLKLFLDKFITHEELKDFNCNTAYVKTEAPIKGGRIDILITDNNKAIIIENKIYACDQEWQLKRYYSHALKTFKGGFQILYLTLYGSQASDNSGEGVNYSLISYSENIIQWLEECVNLSSRFPLVRETLNQYINHLKLLTNQDMDKNNQQELIEILTNPANIESAIKISENIKQAKLEIIRRMVNLVAEEFSINYEVNLDGNAFGFFKDKWKPGSGIWFAHDNGKTYYAIKTPEARNGKAIPQQQIEELFELKAIPYDPYGYGYVLNEHWSNNNQLFIEIANGAFARKIIIPRLKSVLEYLNEHPEIESSI